MRRYRSAQIYYYEWGICAQQDKWGGVYKFSLILTFLMFPQSYSKSFINEDGCILGTWKLFFVKILIYSFSTHFLSFYFDKLVLRYGNLKFYEILIFSPKIVKNHQNMQKNWIIISNFHEFSCFFQKILIFHKISNFHI